MPVRKFEQSDMEDVISWFHKRNINDITPDYISPCGFIRPGVAAGFLYHTGTSFCIFECFVGNPSSSKSERREALEEIVTELIKEAKNLGFKKAFGFATSPTMIDIGYKNEFKFVETCSTIVREL